MWIWIALERVNRKVLGFSIGSRGRKAFESLMRKLRSYEVNCYATDEWKAYKRLVGKHLIGKQHTTNIESLNANVRHYLARFRRRTRCYSKCPIMVKLSLYLLFYGDLIKKIYPN